MTDFFRRTGLLPGATYVVASNAPAATIRQARILKARYGDLIQICDGVADQVEIQAAINASAGKIQLSEGNHNWSAMPTLRDNLTVEGQAEATVIVLGADITAFNIANLHDVHIKNLDIEVSHGHTVPVLRMFSSTRTVRDHCSFENIQIRNPYFATHHDYTAIELQTTGNDIAIFQTRIKNVQAWECNTFLHLDVDPATNGFINGCIFQDLWAEGYVTFVDFDRAGAGVNDGMNRNTFINCQAETAPYSVDGFKNIRRIGNIFVDCLIWDWGAATAPNYKWSIHADARDTAIIGTDIFDSTTGIDNGRNTKLDITNFHPASYENIRTVASFGANYSKLSSALAAIIDASATKRYAVLVFGRVDDDAQIGVKPYIDVIGFNADVRVVSNNNIHGVQAYGASNFTWRDITVRRQGTPGANYSCLYIFGYGGGEVDETAVFENCKFLNECTSVQPGLSGIYIVASQIASPSSTSPMLINCTGKGGSPTAAGNTAFGIRIAGWASPTLIGCTGIGGDTGTYNYAIMIGDSSAPVLHNCIGLQGLGGDYGSSLNISNGAKPIIDGFVGRPQELSHFWVYDDANNGRFRPFGSIPYQLVGIQVYVNVANPAVTLNLGVSVGGSEIAGAIPIGATGSKYFSFSRVRPAADGYMYATPSAPIADGDVTIKYIVIYRYNSPALYVSSGAYWLISNSVFIANGSSPAARIEGDALTIKLWKIDSTHLETYDPSGSFSIYCTGAVTDLPVRNCTLIGLLGNITSFTRETYRQHPDLFMDVLAASANHVVTAEPLNVAPPIACVIAAQPDVPRNITVTITDADVSISAFQINVVGVNAKGAAATEQFLFAGGLIQTGNVAWATITSITVTSITGAGVGDVLDVGIGIKLGLSNGIDATADVYKIKKNNANAVVAAAQVNVTYDTYDMAVIGLAGGDDFTIWFRSNLNIVS